MVRNRLSVFIALAVLAGVATFPVAGAIDPDLLAGLKARSIGPSGMSGRIAAIDAVESSPNVIWVGAATGGVWKSIDGGLTWRPVFDDQPVAAIGALAIDQSNPDVVWVGTGEGNLRNSVSIGNGMYRTLDGGKSWKSVNSRYDINPRPERACRPHLFLEDSWSGTVSPPSSPSRSSPAWQLFPWPAPSTRICSPA